MNPMTSDRFSVIFSDDPAVVDEGSDVGAYFATMDEKHLIIDGKPVRYVFRPMTRRERDYVFAEEGTSRNYSVRGYTTTAIALVGIDGPNGPIVTETQLRRYRRTVGGVSVLADEVFERSDWFPDGAVMEVGNTAFAGMFRERRAADADPGAGA